MTGLISIPPFPSDANPSLSLYVALKAAQITANDDWDLVKRRTKKFFMGGSSKQEDEQIKKKVVVLGSGWGAISFIQQLDLDQDPLVIVLVPQHQYQQKAHFQ